MSLMGYAQSYPQAILKGGFMSMNLKDYWTLGGN